jgi:hypothetical protein
MEGARTLPRRLHGAANTSKEEAQYQHRFPEKPVVRTPSLR